MILLIHVLEAIGLFAVGLCFIILLPNVGIFLASTFSFIIGEQALAKLQGRESGSDMHIPDEA
ncbi:MAG: hypothetical protein ACI8S6_001942 [Myxococcota bacterium]|jgi:hypothetical protein